ncbi:MAG: divalent metal cation transporter [Planctomycetaceae bacterium]|nr:divalent metal cation transporter [Planctomycetaceae bacterium]
MGDGNTKGPYRWLRSIGPGLVTACVVIGPGSILTSSKVGATHGFAMTWVVVASVIFMMVYMSLGAKLGVVTGESAGDLVARTAGRPVAALIGIGVFFIAATFQFGNNLGVDSAVKAYFDWNGTMLVFNAIAIAFLFLFQDLYKALERLMSGFVGLMLVAFAFNLAFALANRTPPDAALIPKSSGEIDLSLLGLVGTTFVVPAAYYQSYLVRFKGWGVKDLKNGLTDARVGSALMALITLMIMANAATVFYGKVSGDQLASVGDVAAQLESAFGPKGRALFCIGLFSAAYSSFLVNSMIGGFMMADGLGLGSKPTDLWPRLLTVAVLLTGMGVAMYVTKSGQPPVGAIVFAQATTVIAAPLMAGALWWLTSRKDLMGEYANGVLTNVLAGAGFLLLLVIAAWVAVVKVVPGMSTLFA